MTAVLFPLSGTSIPLVLVVATASCCSRISLPIPMLGAADSDAVTLQVSGQRGKTSDAACGCMCCCCFDTVAASFLSRC
uniref:Putative secreted protein n=1 Tax=Anopheles triannulatus TaxID=58253 RepID=A0A2M4B4D0_9DIPT